MSDAPDDSLEQRFRDLYARHSQLRDKCHFRSAQRVSRELRQLAKSEGQVVTYLHACHQLMNNAQSLLDPEFGIEVSIESIALLESEEKARLMQPDLPQDQYQYTVHWMSACAYDNLAKHIATRDGYNSDGVHDCITEGIQVCRRTGKLECIGCFREYATDVYKASDDLEMAMHHAIAVEQMKPRKPEDGDRRWVGARDQVQLLLLQGQLELALQAGQRALQLAELFHSPFEAKLQTLVYIEVLLWLLGREAEYPEVMRAANVEGEIGRDIPQGEDPTWEIQQAERDAVRALCRGEHQAAIDLLTKFDQLTAQRKCLDTWFEVRLRLIAATLMAGQTEKAERLAKQLEERAKPARDWLSLRRLKGMLTGEVRLAPVPAVATYSSGPYSAAGVSHSQDGSTSATASKSNSASGEQSPTAAATSETSAATSSAEPEESSPLLLQLDAYFNRFYDGKGSREVTQEIVNELLAMSVASTQNAVEAGRVVHAMHLFAPRVSQTQAAWNWAQAFLEAYPQDATLVSVVGSLGMTARVVAEESDPPQSPDEIVTVERLDELFRRSLDLDPHKANNFARAGQFYLTQDRIGDAERCFARGSRLDRSNTLIAQRLAEIYASTDRGQDALGVLDLCIRQGCQEAPIFHQAAMQAVALGRYQVALSYLQEYDKLEPNEPWIYYYIALCHLELGHPDDALAALNAEAERSPETAFAIGLMRASAAGLAERPDAVREYLAAIESLPMSKVDYLTQAGMARLFDRLFATLDKLPIDDPTRTRWEQLGLCCGLAPDAYFERERHLGEQFEGVNFYVVTFEQHLSGDWANSSGCLSGQEHWTSYEARWGVLARDVNEAEQIARQWQSRCESAPLDLLAIDLQNDGYRERLGVVWQGLHVPVEQPDDMPEVEETDE